MEREQNLEEKPSSLMEMSTQPVSMFTRRKRRWWLLIVGAITACLPLGLLLMKTPMFQGFVFSPALVFTYVPLAAGPVLSAIIWWYLIVNRAPRPTWKRGLVAALVAEFCAYPLTGITLGMTQLFIPFLLRQPIQALSQLLPAIAFLGLMSFIALPTFGLYTTICAIVLGPLLGALQGNREIYG